LEAIPGIMQTNGAGEGVCYISELLLHSAATPNHNCSRNCTGCKWWWVM